MKSLVWDVNIPPPPLRGEGSERKGQEIFFKNLFQSSAFIHGGITITPGCQHQHYHPGDNVNLPGIMLSQGG